MKRGQPLKRKAPLQRGSNSAGGGPSSLRRTRVSPVSPKRALDNETRRAVVAALLAEFPRCQVRWACRGAKAIEVHERLKRSRGGSIIDPTHGHMVTTCRACHELTEAQPAEATRRRMLLPSWHQCPPVGPC